jgi:parallel beta-helix repeat protein
VISVFAVVALPMAWTVEAQGATWYVDGTSGTDDNTHGTGPGSDAFKTIQYAINDARVADGDTINVAAGKYHEAVTIDKSLTLSGKSKETIADGGGTGTAVNMAAGDVAINGFTIQNATYGIDFDSEVQGCIVEGNTVRGISNDGIRVFGASSNIISGNEIFDIADLGIYITTGANNNISKNHIHSCGFAAIELWGSEELAKNNRFEGNTIEDNKMGLVLFGGSESKVIENIIKN